MGISVKMTDDYTSLNAETLQGYQMLIIHRDGRIFPEGNGPIGGGDKMVPSTFNNNFGKGIDEVAVVSDPPLEPTSGEMKAWIQPSQGKAVRDFVENGGSVLFFHNVTDLASTNTDIRDVLGAAYAGHPPIRTFKVRVKRSDHPIMEGITDFVVTDEQHYMEYDKDPEHILMESVNEDGLRYSYKGKDQGTTVPAAWAYEYGKGRVCYLAPGHLLTAHWNPMYRKLKQNAVRWLLRQS
ncbi:ThuA domain-containing protein [Flagellimonas halotolerans]|uniref:ThuA domain-containing protein n=1 Tax=Flagellimonas halotolerans TaxID=3112164 RepID=A0ABU6ITA6_9FLAO|nr:MULTISPECIES: ThuA domain-containing protein [unclassified Allomuricauda]MEC3966364.1 ThuA domain-containing protein [Muricauda sp. SYSU M86414]MEC4266229.1 ThuA domain-containing protein [Muricauda sp. SYSU M84420]